MVRSKYNSTSRGVRGQAFIVGCRNRIALFPNFPVGSEVSYSWDDTSLGTVVGYDKDNGRLLTNLGGSHNPIELKILIKKEA